MKLHWPGATRRPATRRSGIASLRSPRLRFVASIGALALTATTLGGAVILAAPTTPAEAAPGNPGTPSAPTSLYTEDFQNGSGVTTLPNYTSTSGVKYTASSYWLSTADCNGFVVSAADTTRPAGYCNNWAGFSDGEYSATLRKAQALGLLNSPQNPDTNRALSTNTSPQTSGGTAPANQIEFATDGQINLPSANGRFITFSVDAAATSCDQQPPLLRFYFRDAQGTETPVSTSAINPCTDPGTQTSNGVNYGSFPANSSRLLNGSSVGIVLRNESSAAQNGNDGAIDNIRVLDVTPQLDKSFSPTTIQAGGTSTLTFTVTNTSELGQKNGWSFTDDLPDGLTLANNTVGGTCDADTAATAGGRSIAVTNGNLAQGEASCTITVQVTSPTPGSYQNCPSTNVTTVGLNDPACATLTVTDPPEWQCSANGYLFQYDANGTGNAIIYQVDLVTGESKQIGSTPNNTNAEGFNPTDNFVYGYNATSKKIVKIGSDGTQVVVPTPAALDGLSFNVGDFDSDGHYWITQSGSNQRWFEIDYVKGSSTYGQVIASGTTSTVAQGADWVYVDGKLYSINQAGHLVSFDTTSHAVTDLGALNGVPAGNYGAGYADASGYVYFSNNATGEIYRVDPTDKSVIDLSTGPATTGNDGARCASAPIPTIKVTKTVDSRVTADDQFTVGLDNSSDTTLTSATTTGTNTTASTTNWPVSQGATYTITDAMASGSSNPLSEYNATVVCTDGDGNTVTTGGSKGAWTLTVANATDYSCNVTNAAIEQPKLTITKKADTTDLPQPGDTVTYTVTATNTTGADFTTAHPAEVTDDLTEVLDDATFDESSLKATVDGDAVADPTFTSPNINWSGPLAAGKAVVLTYTVTYTGDGDHVMTNNACVPEGDTTPGADSCTSVVIPAPAIDSWKTVEASTDPVAAGTTLTYTLHFENTGAATGPVNKVDDLSGVLDDATVTTEPKVTGPLTATRSGDQLTVTGNLPAGETSTVTYTVTVKPAGERGDNQATNYLLDPNTPPPGGCTPTDDERPDCTTTPISALVVSKSVDPKSGTTVTAGQVVTYTLTFDNSKGKDAAPVTGWKDDLSKVLDDATLTTQPTSSLESLNVGAIQDQAFTIDGSVPAGETGTVTYKVTVKADGQRGDNDLANVLANEDPNVPPIVTENPVPEIVSSKSVDPKSGTEVTPGQVLTYTLTFTNKGQAAGAVDKTDDLTKVVDDAMVTKEPTASNPALQTTPVASGYEITGTLDKGQTVKVTYQVTVKPDGQRGDNQLGNFLIPTGSTPPTTCEDDNTNCTQNPVSSITSWKTVNPTTGTAVTPGQVLTYTLHFKNSGAAAGTVDKVDDITQAVDDATVTKQPTVTGGNLEATPFGSDNRSHITGSLPAGKTVTVSYQLTVKAADKLGDKQVANFLLKPSDPPPTTPDCKPTNTELPNCTSNPVGSLKVSKIVDPKTGTTVHPGDTLHFTLSFENVGKGDAKVDYTDDMTGVLDDATVTTQPVASDDALTVTKVTDGKVGITGTLAAGQKVTVTYAVTTKPYAQQGDHVMENYLDPTGTTPADRCVSTDPLCTRNPIAAPPAPVTPATPGLAFTGTELVGPGLALALMLLALGGGLLIVRRRRQNGETQDNA